MNLDEIKSAGAQVMTAILAFAVATGAITADQQHSLVGAFQAIFTSLSALIPAVLLVINIAASLWRHWNMKKVPETAKVTVPQPKKGN